MIISTRVSLLKVKINKSQRQLFSISIFLNFIYQLGHECFKTGWLFIYTNSENKNPAKVSEGLMLQFGVAPGKILLTSSINQQSVVWIGTSGDLEFRKVTQISDDKLYIITSVVVKNVGKNDVREFYCKVLVLHLAVFFMSGVTAAI